MVRDPGGRVLIASAKRPVEHCYLLLFCVVDRLSFRRAVQLDREECPQ